MYYDHNAVKEKIEELLEIIEKESRDSIEELETGASSEFEKLAFVEGKMEVISKVSGWLAVTVCEMITAANEGRQKK
jgi:hypothetical protein